jgi:head-tail adaptor
MRATSSLRSVLVYVQKEAPEIDDGYGGVIPGGWVTQEEAWARVQPLKGSETVIAARLTGKQPFVITIPMTPENGAIDRSWRIKEADSGKMHRITSFANMDEHGRDWELLTEYLT